MGKAVLSLAFALAIAAPALADEADEADERRRLVAEIAAEAASVRPWTGRQKIDARVLDVLATVPRHLFVPPGQRRFAYDNRPLPIGHSQTISQPLIVALMTDLLDLEPGDSVLEVGTGSAYQAAVLAEMGAQVHTIEIIEPLGREAAERLARLGYEGVQTRLGDGYYGWPAAAPFDAIIVTAAASHIPPPLVRQLKPGGRMVIPVGGSFLTQYLMLVERTEAGAAKLWQLLPVRFVPLTGGH